MQESRVDPEQRHAQLLAARLKRIGVSVDLEEGSSSGVGSLRLTAPALPTLGKPLMAEEARFYTLGHNRIKMFRPAPLFALPALAVGQCESIAGIEVALRNSWRSHIRQLELARRWLVGLGVPVKIDPTGARMLVEFPELQGPPIVVRSARELLLPSSGPLREVSLASPAKRVYRPLSDVDHASDLELGLAHELDRRAREDRAERRPAAAPKSAALRIELPDSGARHILVVDNEQAVRAAVANALSSRGFCVESFPDPLGGLEALRRRTYDAVMVDARMPRMDGLELTATILDLPGIAEFPVLLLDDRPTETSRAVAETVGAAGYLAKPAEWGDLAESLLDLLDGWARRRFDRFPLHLRVEIEGEGSSGPTLTDTVGRGGIQLRTHRDAVPGRIDRYRILLPGSLGSIRVDGLLVYRLDEPGQTRLRLGIRFLGFPDKDEPRWIQMISRLAQGTVARMGGGS